MSYTLMAAINPAAAAESDFAMNEAKTAITRVFTDSYCNGAYNALDTKAMAQGFHSDFAILDVGGDKGAPNEGEVLERYTAKEWIAAIEARKAKAGFDPSSAARTCKIVSLDVTDQVANIKATITKAGKLQYTDYLLLAKFKSGWKIVSKVYTAHN